VFWRDTGTNEDEDDVEAREGACSMETAMFWGGCRREGDGQEAVTLFVRAVADQSASSTAELQREGPSSEKR
jgi:hypothetical protein